ncbi:MAG TPA: cyclic nucleotide-binding domain-containing protein [Myxococcales bacterium]|jgi:CRP-like cAMP-binding protein|nr:cyclic nucleotide-binding domain-containing protein [Myxococcales bacterium]
MAQGQLAREHKDKGIALLVKGKAEAALQEFQLAAQADPQDHSARRKIAEVLAKLGRKDDAIAAYQALAGRLAVRGKLLEATAITKVILQLDPKHTQTQKALQQFAARQPQESWKATLPSPMTKQLDVQPVEDEVAVVGQPIEELPPLPREVMAELLAKVALRSAGPGEAIITEGQRGESMFVLVEGAVEVVRNNAVVDTMAAGAVFGEIALLAEVPRVATIIAAEDSLLLEVTREMLLQVEARHPSLHALLNGFFKKRLLANLLRSNDLFSVFNREALGRLVEEFQLRKAERGDQLITQGGVGRGLWLLLRGRCVPYDTPSGEEYPEMTEGDVFGEIALLELCPATATVRAETDCILLFLDRDSFAREMLQNMAAAKRLDALVRERLQRTKKVHSAFGPALL